ncbi:MAG: hypothetical protein ACPG9P_05875, partial [Candidatus Pseudothioglobus sp.]
MKHLPEITKNLLAVLVVIDPEGTYLSANYGEINDLGFYTDTKKHLFQECDRFILIRFVGGEHFELFYNRQKYEATFSTKEDTEDLTFNPASILLNYADSRSYFALTGKLMKSGVSENTLYNANNLFSDTEVRSIYESNFSSGKIKEIIREKDIQNLEEWSCYQSLFQLLFKEWFTFVEQKNKNDSLTSILNETTLNDKVPVILFPFLINDERKFKYATIYLQKTKEDEVILLDMNSHILSKFHLEENNLLQRIYDVTETTSYTFDQIGVLEKLDFIKIPKKCDLDIIRRHIFSLAYQWTLSTGSLYNSIFDYLGIPSRDCYDGHDISFILMSIDSLLPKCTDRMT